MVSFKKINIGKISAFHFECKQIATQLMQNICKLQANTGGRGNALFDNSMTKQENIQADIMCMTTLLF